MYIKPNLITAVQWRNHIWGD